MPSHADFLPTGKPVIGARRSYGELPYDERFGIGVVGLHEGQTMLVALRSSGLCRAVAACDPDPQKRSEAAEACPGITLLDSIEDLLALPQVRIVAIYTPDPLHAQHIAQAFEAGKHVICTKPLINNLVEAEKLLRIAEQTGMRLQVGQSTRFYEPFQRQRELFESGAFGAVEAVDAHYHHRMDWWYEKSPWSLQQTHWAYLGLSHPVDLLRWYLGPIREVHAYGSTTSLGNRYGLPTPDVISVHVRSDDGRVGRAFGNYGIHELPSGRSLIECHLMGSEGASIARYPELRLTYVSGAGTEIEECYEHSLAGYYYRHELKGMHYGEFCNYADYFASKLLSEEPNDPDLTEGLATVAVMHAIVESLESGTPQFVPPIRVNGRT